MTWSWRPFWEQQQQKWIQYDILSTCSTLLMLSMNVARSTFATSSYETATTVRSLRSTQKAFVLAITVHALVLWLVLQRPRLYAVARHVLTCARWLTVGAKILASTPLPVFQAGASSSSQWWLLRCLGFGFRSNTMFCVIQFLFYVMPWQYMAAISSLYALGGSIATTSYCRNVVSTPGSQNLHADFGVIQRAAMALDVLVGQSGQQSPQGIGLAEAAFSDSTREAVLQEHAAAGQVPWQTTASMVVAACGGSSTDNMPHGRQLACNDALLGQCQATVTTIKFGLTYLLILLMITLERYNKWHYLKQHNHNHYQQPEPPTQPPPLDRASASPSAQSSGADGSNQTNAYNLGAGGGASSHYSNSQSGLLMDPYRAPTAWALLRLELLKLVVLADVPVLILWWALSTFLRPALPAVVQHG